MNLVRRYAERGFSIGVPGLDRKRFNREFMAFNVTTEYGYKDLDCGDGDGGDGYPRFSEAIGLERLVFAESIQNVLDGTVGKCPAVSGKG